MILRFVDSANLIIDELQIEQDKQSIKITNNYNDKLLYVALDLNLPNDSELYKKIQVNTTASNWLLVYDDAGEFIQRIKTKVAQLSIDIYKTYRVIRIYQIQNYSESVAIFDQNYIEEVVNE